MSRHVLRSKNLIIAEHSTTLEIPLSYVLYEKNGFKIGIYQDSLTTNHQISDVPFCIWYPDGQGCRSISSRFLWYRDAGLVPQMEELCQQMYEAWKAGEDDQG